MPIIAITADKNPYYLGQREDQMLDQVSVYDNITKFNCSLPIVNDEKDYWYCSRLLNEAFLEINHHGMGPVHINIPIEDGMFAIGGVFTTEQLPEVKQTKRFDLNCKCDWEQIFTQLYEKKVLVLCGQDNHVNQRKITMLEQIFESYNCLFAVDKLSNLHCNGTLELTRAYKCLGQQADEVWPDVIISLGGNTTLDYRFALKNPKKQAEHWLISPSGKYQDPFRKLTYIFEGDDISFLEKMALYGTQNSKTYYNAWKKYYEKWENPEFGFSNIYAIKELMAHIPAESVLNIGNSSPVRISQYFDLDDSVQVYCNRGIHGIDGCVSVFVGQAEAAKDKLNFLIVGDLSFFYDMNALWNRYQGNNIRIMLSNNGGASLFHFNQGLNNYPSLNKNVAGEHFSSAKGWAESQGYRYLEASTKEEFDNAINAFVSCESEKPILLEVFTDKAKDAKLQHEWFDLNKPVVVHENTYVEPKSVKVKQKIRKMVGDSTVEKIKGIMR